MSIHNSDIMLITIHLILTYIQQDDIWGSGTIQENVQEVQNFSPIRDYKFMFSKTESWFVIF